MKRSILSLISFFTVFKVFSATINFPVAGLLTSPEDNCELSLEWNDSWFTNDTAFNYNHGIARAAALFSELAYTNVAENPESNYLKMSYKKIGIQESNMEFHYDLNYSMSVVGDDQAAFSFASKQISSETGTKTLVFVVIRGTTMVANEWISNLDISDKTHKNSTLHEGFYRTAVQVHNALIYYLLKQRINPDEVSFLITGHSRGAAVANILGAQLLEEAIFNPEHIYVYTFATPNVTQDENAADFRYDFIWNIINGEDIVPTVPPYRNKWKFRKYGHVLTIPNRWNTDTEIYDQDYIPKVNNVYNKLIKRDYAPFKNGTFLQSSITRLLTSIYKDVDDYYSAKLNLRSTAETILWKMFPEPEDDKKKDTESVTEKLDKIQTKIVPLNERTDGAVNYLINAFMDMHACEMYLSWMVALDEKDLYKKQGSYQLVIDGYYECAVFDEDGNLLAQILDGVVQMKKTKVPIAATPWPAKKTLIGFPSNENFKFVIYKATLLPTIISTRLEEYDVTGNLTYTYPKKRLYPQVLSTYTFKAGKVFEEDTEIKPVRYIGSEAKKIVRECNFEKEYKINVQPEINIDTDGKIGLGIHAGVNNFYGSILASHSVPKFGKCFELAPGIGYQCGLYGNIKLDTELYSRFVIIVPNSDVSGNYFNIVPSARVSMSFKPVHRFQMFIAGMFDLKINGFNNGAFDDEVRDQNIQSLDTGSKLKIVPSLHFGLKF